MKMWQYAMSGDVCIHGVTAAVVYCCVLFFIYPEAAIKPMPRSIYPIAWLLNLGLTGGSRFVMRSLREYRNGFGKIDQFVVPSANAKRALIVGAGEAGAMVARELRTHPNLSLIPVGFVDDDLRKQGLDLYNIPVLGTREDIPGWLGIQGRRSYNCYAFSTWSYNQRLLRFAKGQVW